VGCRRTGGCCLVYGSVVGSADTGHQHVRRPESEPSSSPIPAPRCSARTKALPRYPQRLGGRPGFPHPLEDGEIDRADCMAVDLGDPADPPRLLGGVPHGEPVLEPIVAPIRAVLLLGPCPPQCRERRHVRAVGDLDGDGCPVASFGGAPDVSDRARRRLRPTVGSGRYGPPCRRPDSRDDRPDPVSSGSTGVSRRSPRRGRSRTSGPSRTRRRRRRPARARSSQAHLSAPPQRVRLFPRPAGAAAFRPAPAVVCRACPGMAARRRDGTRVASGRGTLACRGVPPILHPICDTVSV
jgi:hypothetical protein